jgi:hypothetical protein
MKAFIIIFCFTVFISCKNTMKLAVPDKFKEQAIMLHVDGARKNKMSFANFSTTKIKRGFFISSTSTRFERNFSLENVVLSSVGVNKEGKVSKTKGKFQYTITDGKNTVQVFAKETQFTRNNEYKILGGKGAFSSFEQMENSQYIFSAIIAQDSAQDSKNWELMMTNIYDRKSESKNKIFSLAKDEENGLATNGVDTIFIKGLNVKKTESPTGKVGSFPIKLLSGYELSNSDGVVAIIDDIDKNIWFYKELDESSKLNIAAITTAIFARRVKDTW